ncbi:MAG TPA: FkbM family methyltransferase [Polyangiaceae bacterium]
MVPQGTSELESHAVRSSDDRSLPRVRACRIDDVVTSDMTGPIAGMKLDIEGFELEALRGAESFLARPEVILFCELNEKMLRKAGASVDEVVAFLRERGFSFLTVEGEPFDRYDPTWPDYKNAVFHKGSEAARRVQAAFASSR